MNTNDITVLIQGPINKNSLDNIENYINFGRVLVKYWDDDDNESDLLKHPLISKISIQKEQRNIEPFMGTFRWQVDGIYFALKEIKTKYTIRTRSDESFSDLSPLINKFKKNPKRLVCGSVFWRNCTQHMNQKHRHVGDHIFMGETKTLKKTYQLIKEMQDNNEAPRTWCPGGHRTGNPESSLYYNYLKVFKDENPDQTPTKTLEVFDIINMEKLGEYKICRAQTKDLWTNQNPMPDDLKTSLSLLEETHQLEGKEI